MGELQWRAYLTLNEMHESPFNLLAWRSKSDLLLLEFESLVFLFSGVCEWHGGCDAPTSACVDVFENQILTSQPKIMLVTIIHTTSL